MAETVYIRSFKARMASDFLHTNGVSVKLDMTVEDVDQINVYDSTLSRLTPPGTKAFIFMNRRRKKEANNSGWSGAYNNGTLENDIQGSLDTKPEGFDHYLGALFSHGIGHNYEFWAHIWSSTNVDQRTTLAVGTIWQGWIFEPVV